ncbi:hypothetical protein TNCV_4383291 [Trichonephila clavipes]|nr:hypothetical protein TNCV_4383291 [Trichonephila clavipes]
MSPKRLYTSRLTGASSLQRPVYSEAWAKGNAKVSLGYHFSPHGMPQQQTCGLGDQRITPFQCTRASLNIVGYYHLTSPRQPMTVRKPNRWTHLRAGNSECNSGCQKEFAPIPIRWSRKGIS